MRRIIGIMRIAGIVFVALLATSPAFANQPADLVAHVTAPDTVQPGETIHVITTIQNNGPGVAKNVVLDRWIAGPTQSCESPMFPGDLAPGESRTYDCVTTIPAGPLYLVTVESTVFSDTTEDPFYENNGESKTMMVVTPPDLGVNVENLVVVKPALPFTARIRYWNLANATATGVKVTIVSSMPILAAPPSCLVTGSTAVCDVGTVEPLRNPGNSEPGRIELQLMAPDGSEAPARLEVRIAGNEAENVPADNTFIAEFTTWRTFFVTSDADSGAGSLREAATAAATHCDDEVPCLIAFRIPRGATPWHTIRLGSPLPPMTGQKIEIDGTTQAAYVADTNPDGPEIEITSNAGIGNGLELSACSGAIRGLAMNGFAGTAVLTLPRPGCLPRPYVISVEGNYIGVDPTGSIAIPNGRGVTAKREDTTIRRNVISGNRRSAVFVEAGSRYGTALVTENVIGLDAKKTVALGNGASGVFVGPTASGTDVIGNTIAFSSHFGVAVARDARNVGVLANSIRASGQLAIDWGLDGLPTTEPVPLPEITDVRVENGATIIEGRTSAGGTFSPQVQLFANDAPDPSGYGEGQYYLGETREIGGGGFWRFRYEGDLRGKWIAATVTRHVYVGWLRAPGQPRPDGDLGDYFTTTSEFSRCVLVP